MTGLRDTLSVWTVAVNPTDSPAVTFAGLADKVVVALLCATPGLDSTFEINSKAEKRSKRRTKTSFSQQISAWGVVIGGRGRVDEVYRGSTRLGVLGARPPDYPGFLELNQVLCRLFSGKTICTSTARP